MKSMLAVVIVQVILFYIQQANALTNSTDRSLTKSISWCSPVLCGNKQHIACGNNGKFAKFCPNNAHLIDMSRYRSTVLRYHNRFRNSIASGKFGKFSAARRMATMEWNSELANLAVLNVKQCQIRHDKCRSTPRFRYAGQNLALKAWTGTGRRNPERIIASMIKNFFAEHRAASRSVMRKYHSPRGGKKYGHFTAMMNEKATHIGCGAAQYKRGKTTTFLMACDYAYTNVLGKPVYYAGRAAGRCKTGRNKTYRNLCSTNEKYAVNVV